MVKMPYVYYTHCRFAGWGWGEFLKKEMANQKYSGVELDLRGSFFPPKLRTIEELEVGYDASRGNSVSLTEYYLEPRN